MGNGILIQWRRLGREMSNGADIPSTSAFEIEHYRTLIRVEPHDPNLTVSVLHGSTTRDIQADNVATVRREVVFAADNDRCDLFEIRFATYTGGFLAPTSNVTNETRSKNIGMYDAYGVEWIHEFRPELGRAAPYFVELKIYKGFDAGHRDVHFHLGQDTHHYRDMLYELDLSKYVEAGRSVTGTPLLYLHHEDPIDHDICALRVHDKPIQADEHETRGLWRWRLRDIHRGVVDIVWDVE